jgi:hypothetical protein
MRDTGNQAHCRYWQAKIDPRLEVPVERADEMTEEMIMEGFECLLELEGNSEPARFGGATHFEVSQIAEPPSVAVAALYYISYLFTGNWSHADMVALRGRDGSINSQSTVAKAYRAYRSWYDQVKKIGLKKARPEQLDPLTGSGISWY